MPFVFKKISKAKKQAFRFVIGVEATVLSIELLCVFCGCADVIPFENTIHSGVFLIAVSPDAILQHRGILLAVPTKTNSATNCCLALRLTKAPSDEGAGAEGD